ncbi:MAG: SMP-30/gluconolactonase/LRE family protein [Burkholderiaceae bacterium]
MRPADDVATALFDLPRGALVNLESGSVKRAVRLIEDIPAGHKFAVHALACGLRVRKYGECIGRTTEPVPAGAWVHLHNLETSAHGDGSQDLARQSMPGTARLLGAIGDPRCCVGENPLFDAETGRLYWIDVRETPAIHALELGTGQSLCWPMREDIGSIALAGAGRLLLALRSGFAWFDVASGDITPIADPEADLPLNRLNDGKCDPAGRYWCASMQPDAGSAEGSLYMLDGDLRCHKVLGDLVTPNGINWSPDGRTMYLADTRRGFIYAYPFDVSDGKLGERRIFADLGAMPGGPDGAAVDAEGHLWWAQFDGACLIRFAPDGSVNRVVRLPVTKPTSCGFGGAGLRQLYVTSATRGLSAAELNTEPMAGRVLVLDVGVAGLPPVPFLRNVSRGAAQPKVQAVAQGVGLG